MNRRSFLGRISAAVFLFHCPFLVSGSTSRTVVKGGWVLAEKDL